MLGAAGIETPQGFTSFVSTCAALPPATSATSSVTVAALAADQHSALLRIDTHEIAEPPRKGTGVGLEFLEHEDRDILAAGAVDGDAGFDHHIDVRHP